MPLGMCANMPYIYNKASMLLCNVYSMCASFKKVNTNHKLMMITEDCLTPRKTWRNFCIIIESRHEIFQNIFS